MFKKSGLLTFYAETSLHMGSGTSLSYVDLPIQREKHTEFPIMQASGIKGVIREFAERQWEDETKVEVIFGPKEGDKFASCVVFTDARILLFPVRSVAGIFAWVTCPFVLKRFKKDLESAGISFDNINIPEPSKEEKIIIVTSDSILKIQNINQVMLEEFVFDIENNGKGTQANQIAKKIKELLPQNSSMDLINDLPKRFAIVADDVFKDFVKLAIEIQTRIKIDQTTGTVQEGALFTEELVPSQSVFYSLVFFNDPYLGLKEDLRKKIENFYKSEKTWEEVLQEVKNKGWNGIKEEIKKYVEEAYQKRYLIAEDFFDLQTTLFKSSNLLQLGGDETIGKGLVRVKFTQGG